MTGYANSVFYTVAGTALAVALTMIAAYPLSRKDFGLSGPIMLIFTFTMFFSGGLIPTYLLMSALGLVNTRTVMIVPGALSVYNVILTRTFIRSSIPAELHEAGQIDGCSDFMYFRTVVCLVQGDHRRHCPVLCGRLLEFVLWCINLSP